jgi:radical SAM superfamily enzyme YgiQ (UPF0313 family)
VEEAGLDPQLGILNLAAVLEEGGTVPQIVDLNRLFLSYSNGTPGPRRLEFAEIAAQAIAAKEARLYGFSSICSTYPLTVRIARIVKELRPESNIVCGGPQASAVDSQTLLAFPFVDFVLRGEAERTLPLLLEQLEGESRFCEVPGLSYRDGAQVCRNANAKVIEDLDTLPSPAYHLTRELHGADRAALELGRGCPYACTFCSTNDFFRRNFRLRSPERVLRDMKWLATSYGIRDFDLVHDMFTVDRRRVVAFCEAMIASGEQFTWSCSARTDRIDKELLELMSHAGCCGIFFGVEVGSERMQKIIDKHLDPDFAKQVIDATERAGISSTVSLITGFPEETWEDLRQTGKIFMHSARSPRSHPQLNLLAPLAATPIYSKHKSELVLEDLCSSLSHQGEAQSAADLQLIRDYPEIFPNFYAIPTLHLDRVYLLELREFTLMATARFRWLLVAIDQNSKGIVDFFLEWRQFRRRKHPELEGLMLRQYYRSDRFQTEFLSFVRSHPVSTAFCVEALLDYEACAKRPASCAKPEGRSLTRDTKPRRCDIPVRKTNMAVLKLNYDMQRIIDALKSGSEPACNRGAHFYVSRAVSVGLDRLVKISDWMAHLLRLCNGRRRVHEIVERLSSNLVEVDERLRPYVCLRMIQGAQAEGFIDIYRSSFSGQKSPRSASTQGCTSRVAS